MNIKIFLVMLCIPFTTMAETPEQIKGIAWEKMPTEWYTKQARLWKNETDKNPHNANAWLNYYQASRYANFENLRSWDDAGKDKEEMLANIFMKMEKNVPGTYEYNRCKLGQLKSGQQQEEYELVTKLYKQNPKDAGVLETLINFYEFTNDKASLAKYYKELNDLGRFDIHLKEYNFNMFMSVGKGAILFTGGDNDTYPARYLQLVKNIRPDITLMNIYLAAASPEYTAARLKEKNILIATTKVTDFSSKKIDAFAKDLVTKIRKLYPDVPIYIASTAQLSDVFPDSLYCTGLADLYSEKKIDNLPILKANIEGKFHLDYLKPDCLYDIKKTTIGERFKQNYALPFVMLYKYGIKTGLRSEMHRFYMEYFVRWAIITRHNTKESVLEYLQKEIVNGSFKTECK